MGKHHCHSQIREAGHRRRHFLQKTKDRNSVKGKMWLRGRFQLCVRKTSLIELSMILIWRSENYYQKGIENKIHLTLILEWFPFWLAQGLWYLTLREVDKILAYCSILYHAVNKMYSHNNINIVHWFSTFTIIQWTNADVSLWLNIRIKILTS